MMMARVMQPAVQYALVIRKNIISVAVLNGHVQRFVVLMDLMHVLHYVFKDAFVLMVLLETQMETVSLKKNVMQEPVCILLSK